MKCKQLAVVLTSVVLVGCFVSYGMAETLPGLGTQDANTLPEGQVDLTMQLTYFHNDVPEFSNGKDHADFYELPRIGANIGVVDKVEVQVDWSVNKINSTVYGNNFGPGDARIFTKINVIKEDGNIPSLGVRFGFKAPDADDKKGLGDNRADLFAEGLISKKLGPVETNLNLGLALYDNVSTNFGQDDLLTYDFAVLYPVIDKLKIAGEIVGTACSKVNNNTSLARVGVQYDIQNFTVDANIGAGLNKNTAECVVGAGFVYHLRNLWGNNKS